MSGVVDVLVTVLIIAAVAALLVAVAVVAKRGLVTLPLRHSAIVTRKFGSIRRPSSFAAAVGAHTRLLEGGQLRWVAWWLYDVVVIENVIIPPDSVGIVHALHGEPLRTNQTVADPVPCHVFRDVGAFLAGGGQQGPQVEVLPGGSHAIHPGVFRVDIVKRVTVPMRSIGLVKANVGAIMSPGHTLARHVECDHFQDGVAFLAGGGEQGIQQAVLPGGSNYAINPVMFDVITVDNVEDQLPLCADDLRLVSVDSEDVGVVIVTESGVLDEGGDGDAPAPVIPGHDHFQRPWVFLANGGRVGPQAEVLPGGSTYAINPLFARVVHIPTRELILSWRAKDAAEDRYDSALQPVELTIEGFSLRVELTQTLAIPARSAPGLVKRFGEDADEDGDTGHRKPAAVKRLVEKVLGQVVKGYFNEVSSKYQIEDFIRGQETVRSRLSARVAHALGELGVEARLTTIVSVKFESDEINAEFRKVADSCHEVLQLEQQISVERVRNKVVEEQLKAERAKLAASEEVLIGLFGREHHRRERILDLKMTAPVPQVIVAGSGDTPLGPLMLPPLTRGDRRPLSRRRGATIPITIYLSDESVHHQVEIAVEDLLKLAGIQIEHRDDAVLGSWFRRMRAAMREVAHSQLGSDVTSALAHTVESRLILAHDANVTATMLQNLGPVIAALQPTKDAVIRVGALLIVKVDWTVVVHQLTAAQQLQLDHQPQLATAPHDILAALELATNNDNGLSEDSIENLGTNPAEVESLRLSPTPRPTSRSLS